MEKRKTKENPSVTKYKNERGITLIALVVTIVVLIILAVISINVVLGENGLIKQAERASGFQANAEAEDSEVLSKYDQMIANAMAKIEEGSQEPTETPVDITIGPNGKKLTSTVISTEHTGTDTEDILGNSVYIPGGFKIAEDSGSSVKEGIVIEDSVGNQFVWIPVSNINGDGSNKIKVDENTEVEITLGRYNFVGCDAIMEQKGSEYAYTTLEAINAGTVERYSMGGHSYEIADFRESTESWGMDGTNTTAKDLAGFIESVEEKHGYYLARYEASYASGSTFGVGDDETYYKPASKVSTAYNYSKNTMSYIEGTLWNNLTQGEASKVCRQMYYGNEYVESDLVNSYAFDTAIVYIQAMGNDNYPDQLDEDFCVENTGTSGEEDCKIFDLIGNFSEWNTEYSTYITGNNANPCIFRCGVFSNWSLAYSPQVRECFCSMSREKMVSFRPMIYCKTGA